MQSDDRFQITGAQLRAARALLRWSAEQLAEKTKIGIATIRRAENVDGSIGMTAANASSIRAALEAAGVEFTNGGQPGVRLKPILVHTESGSKRLLFAISGTDRPPGKWDGGSPLHKLPKFVRLNEHGWFVHEEPTEEHRRLARTLYSTTAKR